ncbi:MarR family winged helix-turn-helix transcriptional regulator [Bacillus solimangrovi]|uniref:Transcriptional regulator n=1 Tax=Bacillus solimangrovi TaxID=1305675 RepID=A0A1E5LDD9_9BACI|nr:MarR family transcriptional regulator [Bacillus solimangrovi]OEH92082.1 transcriptional regulator [Bacillus solimangrovi]
MLESCSKSEEIIYQLYGIHKEILSKFERCTGIGQSRLELLHKLYESGEISQTALQKELNIDRAAVTRHLKQLEEKGIVFRRKNPSDNRITFVSLTDEGHQKIVAYREEKARFIINVLKGFEDEERTILLDMLTRIQNNVEQI